MLNNLFYNVLGAGFGVMMSVSYTMFNRYFIKKRILMMGLAQTFLGIGSMMLPIMIAWLMKEFGFRGCLAIVAAVNGHAVWGMLVMHPVEWHLKKEKLTDEEACNNSQIYLVQILFKIIVCTF